MSFSPKQLADIAEARSRMTVIHDPQKRELLVSWTTGGRPVAGGWMLFAYDRPEWRSEADGRLSVEGMSATVRCQESITGVKWGSLVVDPWEAWENWIANAAWEVARDALVRRYDEVMAPDSDGGDSDRVFVISRGDTTPPPSRITTAVQWYLAVRGRVDAWGGLSGEAAQLPGLYANLNPEDRAAVDDRLAGKIVT